MPTEDRGIYMNAELAGISSPKMLKGMKKGIYAENAEGSSYTLEKRHYKIDDIE